MLKKILGRSKFILLPVVILVLLAGVADVFAAHPDIPVADPSQHAWWYWPLILLILSFVLGVFAVMAGVGGGVLYVPIVSGFLPFHLDFDWSCAPYQCNPDPARSDNSGHCRYHDQSKKIRISGCSEI